MGDLKPDEEDDRGKATGSISKGVREDIKCARSRRLRPCDWILDG